MAHHEPEIPLSHEERIFKEYMQRADDFFKIEIFRSAKSWYQKALELKMDEKYIQDRIEECDRLLRYEKKVFSIIGAIALCFLITGLILLG